MTVTYPHDRPLPQDSRPDLVREEPFVPVYARDRRSTRGRKDGLKTWMILAPVGVLVLGAGAAAMVMGSGDEVAPAPLIEPAATGPVLPPQPVAAEAVPVESVEPTPTVEGAPAPAARRAEPAPARRAARASTPVAPTPAPAERAVVVAEPTGPRAYTGTLNAEPASSGAQTPAPVIVIQPAD